MFKLIFLLFDLLAGRNFFFFLELVLLEIEIAFNEAVTEGIQEILNQIGEGNEIFKDLAVLVNDQGAMIV